jgi:hypothetical protein
MVICSAAWVAAVIKKRIEAWFWGSLFLAWSFRLGSLGWRIVVGGKIEIFR